MIMKSIKDISTVYIAGKPFDVTWVAPEDQHRELEDNLGKATWDLQQIWIRSNMPEGVSLEAFWHEVLHMIITDVDEELGESTVRRLANALTNVLLSTFNLEQKGKQKA